MDNERCQAERADAIAYPALGIMPRYTRCPNPPVMIAMEVSPRGPLSAAPRSIGLCMECAKALWAREEMRPNVRMAPLEQPKWLGVLFEEYERELEEANKS